MSLLDIGGGFPGEAGCEPQFEEVREEDEREPGLGPGDSGCVCLCVGRVLGTESRACVWLGFVLIAVAPNSDISER